MEKSTLACVLQDFFHYNPGNIALTVFGHPLDGDQMDSPGLAIIISQWKSLSIGSPFWNSFGSIGTNAKASTAWGRVNCTNGQQHIPMEHPMTMMTMTTTTPGASQTDQMTFLLRHLGDDYISTPYLAHTSRNRFTNIQDHDILISERWQHQPLGLGLTRHLRPRYTAFAVLRYDKYMAKRPNGQRLRTYPIPGHDKSVLETQVGPPSSALDDQWINGFCAKGHAIWSHQGLIGLCLVDTQWTAAPSKRRLPQYIWPNCLRISC
jgi:hypothetical protein